MKRLRKTLLLSLLCLCVLLSGIPTNAYADDTATEFDKSNVLDDLQSATGFNLLDYPYDSTGVVKHPEIMNIVEYCYSFKANMQGNYGLYLYFYNPQALDILTNSAANKVQMAVSYNADGTPKNYEKFNLQFCNMSVSPNYYRLFYKFKVIDHISADGKTILQRVNSNARRYDISGVELHTSGNANATEYLVGGSYTFTGYAKGYGADEIAFSSLQSVVTDLETVTLDVHHTYYRTLTSSKGTGYQNQVDTVYFSVPKRLFDTYGALQRIKAEWYEYKTKDIVVTSNSDFYSKAHPYLGVRTGILNSSGIPSYNSNIYYSLGQDAYYDSESYTYYATWGWNLGTGYKQIPCDTLYYLFQTSNIANYDPYGELTESGGIKSNVLYDYILNYSKTFQNGTLPIKNGRISADLFASDIDNYRKQDTANGKIQKGYSYYDFDADLDTQILLSWQDSAPSFWDNALNWGLWNTVIGNIPQEESRVISPLYALKSNDFNGTTAEIADRLLMKTDDIATLKAYYETESQSENEVMLFRFAATDYYSAETKIVELGKGFLGADKYTSGQAYRAWESVFLDFDIIQLTFTKEGNYTVIPAVSNPIDIVNDITSPVNTESNDSWKVIFMLLALILLCVLLAPLLPYILRVILWLITLPFKAVAALIRGIQGNSNNKRR